MRKPRSDYPSEQADKFLLRFPDGLRDRIRKAADANGRSMNAEIIRLLENAYPPEPTLDDMLSDLNSLLDAQSVNMDREFEGHLIRKIERLKLKISATRKQLAAAANSDASRKPDP